jgi:membrane fusion protein, multidrug efflux system
MDHETRPVNPASPTSPADKDQRPRQGFAMPEEEPIAAVPMYRNMKVVIPLLLIAAGLAVAVWLWYVDTHGYISSDDAFIDADRVAVSSKILGRIVQLKAEESDTVQAAQPLVYLDDRDLKAQQQQAEASAVLAQQNVKLAQISLDRAQQDFQRAQSQFTDKVIPAEQFDHAQKELEAARARLAISQAQVGTAEAQKTVIDTQLENTVISAPMHGVISKRWVLPGDVVQAGQPIFSIYNLDSVWVTANLEETKLGSLRVNDPVQIAIDAYPGQKFSGSIMELGSNTAGQFSLIPPNKIGRAHV